MLFITSGIIQAMNMVKVRFFFLNIEMFTSLKLKVTGLQWEYQFYKEK